MSKMAGIILNDKIPDGFYYLHIDGELFYQTYLDDIRQDLEESDFVKRYWPVFKDDRTSAWVILIDAAKFGANIKQIKELAEKWGVNNADVYNFVKVMKQRYKVVSRVISLLKPGIPIKVWFVIEPASPFNQIGIGETALDAFIDFAKQSVT